MGHIRVITAAKVVALLTLCTATVQLKLATETVTAEKPLLSLITISVRGQMLKMAFRAQLD